MSTAAFWADKCVIVTGASSGIGRALARELAHRGAKLGVLAPREAPLAALVSEIRAAGRQADYRVANVTQSAALATVVTELEQLLGACDVAIANAGIYRQTDGS